MREYDFTDGVPRMGLKLWPEKVGSGWHGKEDDYIAIPQDDCPRCEGTTTYKTFSLPDEPVTYSDCVHRG